MLNKIKMFILAKRGEYYEAMCRYYANESVGFSKLGRYDEVERCQDLSTMYLVKECDVISQIVRMAY